MIVYISVLDDLKLHDEETAVGEENSGGSPFLSINSGQEIGRVAYPVAPACQLQD